MTPYFPSRNLIFQLYNEFFEREFALGFSNSLITDETSLIYQEFVSSKIKYYESLLKPFEDEINQTIFSNNSTLINSLFNDLKFRRQNLYPFPDLIKKKVETWNNNSVKKFNMVVFDQYLSFLNEQADKMARLVDGYIRRYDEGEFRKNEKEETYYDKTTKKAKNTKLIVWLLLAIIVVGGAAALKKDIIELFYSTSPLSDTLKVSTTHVEKNKKDLKRVSGTILDERGNPIRNAVICLTGDQSRIDTTDSFGKFFLADLTGDKIGYASIHITSRGLLDTTINFKIDYTANETIELPIITLKHIPMKSNRQLCEEGNADACYKYANEVRRMCPQNEGSDRTACIMKAEIWRAVGDRNREMQQMKQDSGANSSAYKKAKEKWNNIKVTAKKWKKVSNG